MNKNYSLSTIAAFFLVTGSAIAQCNLSLSTTAATVCSGQTVTITATATPPVTANSLQSTLSGGNNHRGNMFDIYATNNVTITSFDAHPMGNTTIEVYYRASAYAGFETSSAGWTLIGSAAVTAQPFGTVTPVPVAVNVAIPAGQTYAFYVTSSNTAVSLNYTDGTAEGATYVSDANITFRQGVGMEYPFTGGTGSVFRPRVWNGVIHYSVPGPTPVITYLWNTAATTQSINPTVNSTSQYTVQVDVTGCTTMYDTIDVVVSNPPVSAGTDQSVCEGSAVTLSGSGAVSYSWNNGVTNAAAFTPASTSSYIVTGTDSIGCTDADTVTVTVNSLPAVNAGTDLSVCQGTQATLAGSGAVTYVWDNGVTDNVAFTPSSTNTYIVTGTDANNCSNNDTIAVTVNSLPLVSAGSDDTVCAGTQVVLAGSGAVTYAWDNGVSDNIAFTPASTNTYIVTGTDANNCSRNDTVTIIVNSLPIVNAGNDDTICSGSQVTLAGSGAINYSWNNGITDNVSFAPVSTLDYIVTGTDANNCAGMDTVTVVVNTVDVTTSSLDETITANAAGASYLWMDCGTSLLVNGETGQSFTATVNGSYAVIVTEGGCTDTSACENIVSVGFTEFTDADEITVYPNPTSGEITVNNRNRAINELTIFDVTGKVLISLRPVSTLVVLDLQDYTSGAYFLRVISGNGTKTLKLIKE